MSTYGLPGFSGYPPGTVLWNPGGPHQPAPQTQLQKLSHGPDGAPVVDCPAQWFRRSQYRTWEGLDMPLRLRWVLSDRPRTGFFWWVLACSLIYTDPNAQSVSLWLIPPGTGPTRTTNVDDDFFSAAANGRPPRSGVKVDPFSQQAGQGDSFSGSSLSVIDGGVPLIVPGDWALMGYQGDVGASGQTSRLILRAALIEMPIGSEMPSRG